MKQGIFTITENRPLTCDTFWMSLTGEHAITKPGQFVQIALDGFYLRRPISVCDWDVDRFSIIYRIVGDGTRALSDRKTGQQLDILTGLGNGFDPAGCARSLLIGGGVGVPPLYGLAKTFRALNKPVAVALGFNRNTDVLLEAEFRALGCETRVATLEGNPHATGFVTELLHHFADCDRYFTCGPESMLQAVHRALTIPGQLSFESRMACGFGACMGCSCRTKYGVKRICKDGPVLESEAVIW